MPGGPIGVFGGGKTGVWRDFLGEINGGGKSREPGVPILGNPGGKPVSPTFLGPGVLGPLLEKVPGFWATVGKHLANPFLPRGAFGEILGGQSGSNLEKGPTLLEGGDPQGV